MFLTEPIKTIKGLFNSYKNEQVVPADEYNANITCLQQAIEHNGSVLDEHAKAIENIATGSLPEGAIQTGLIADEAVTLPKLEPNIRKNMLLTPETISNYFQDFIVQCHKSNPDIQGSFMNGAIQPVKQTLTRQTTYTKTVTHGDNEYLRVVDPDGDTSYRTITVPYANQGVAETYELAVPYSYSTYGVVKGFGFTWVTRYTLDQVYNINTATDELVIKWDHVSDTKGDLSSSGYCEVLLKDANDITIATLPEKYFSSYTQSSSGYRHEIIGADIAQLSAQVFENVSVIEIKTKCYSSYPGFGGSYDEQLLKNLQPSLSINMRFSAGTTEYMQYETTVPSANSINYATIGAHIKTTTPVDFNTYKFYLAPYCIGVCPHQPAPGFESQIISYINETDDSVYSASLIDSSSNRYYIRHNFQAPLIISAKIKEDKPDALHPDFTVGEYYSWPLHFTENTYITYSNLNDTIQGLKDYFSDYIEDITYTEYSLGTTQLGIRLGTTVNNVTVDSVSAAKYAGFIKPAEI